jgi:hypothetical protein
MKGFCKREALLHGAEEHPTNRQMAFLAPRTKAKNPIAAAGKAGRRPESLPKSKGNQAHHIKPFICNMLRQDQFLE